MRHAGVLVLLASGLLGQNVEARAAEAYAQSPARPADVSAFAAQTQATSVRIKQLDLELVERQRRVVSLGRRYVRTQRVGALAVVSDLAHVFAHVDRESRVRRQLVNDLGQGAALQSERARLQSELARASTDSARLGGQATLWTQDGGESRRDEAFSTAFNAGSSYQAVGETAVASPFARARGQLLTPVATSELGSLVHREGAEGPGLEFRAARGAAVRAVFAGRVAFSDRFGPYGRMVILDHGDHYYTVYGDLGAVSAVVGDELGAGAKLGTVNDEGRGVVYVEVRHRTETVEPGAWFGE